MLNCLSYIGEKVSDNNIRWGLGGSLLLYFYHIIDTPNDIDIIVHEEDASYYNEVIKKLGEKKETIHKEPFCTKYFYQYKINEMNIDVMGGFGLQHSRGTYKMMFDDESIVSYKIVNGVNIPLTALEDWYVMYQLIPKKQKKSLLIEQYFKKNGIKNPNLLRRSLDQPLPSHIRERIRNLI